MYTLTANNGFKAGYTEKELSGGVKLLHLRAVNDTPSKLELKLEWNTPDIGVNACYSPMGYQNKKIRPNWGGYVGSNAMSSAPVFSNLAYDDSNRMTLACSDAKNSVKFRSGVVEESAEFVNTVLINVDCLVTDYECDIRIDTRDIPFYKCVEDVSKWWETYDGYEPIKVPDTAKSPLYSAWYSFHQQIDVPAIVEECRFFGKLGCKSLIVDDGWQTDNNARGYAYCGDWEPTPAKIPDMKAFVDAVHETGLKFVLWYSVPFVGLHSKAYERFKGKFLEGRWNDTFTLDPRYPEVREYLINIYRNAVLDWGLDGFKLDFIDSFRQSDVVKEGMDYVSVYDAVDRLMKDVMRELTKLNPEILIEFRQSYMGPLMRTFGNMIRSGDCPNDSYQNRLNTLSLRMTSGNTAVHSDMVMWNYDEPVELAAFQLTHVLFSVPQISVRHDRMPGSHAKMVKTYLDFWTRHRDVLLDGEMFYKNYASDYTYVSSKKDGVQVGAVYAGRFAYINEPTEKIIVVNASLENEVVFDCKDPGAYSYEVFDCLGEKISDGGFESLGFARVPVPVNGRVELTAK